MVGFRSIASAAARLLGYRGGRLCLDDEESMGCI